MAQHGTAGQPGALFEGQVSGDLRDRRRRRNPGRLGLVAILNTMTSGVRTAPAQARISRALTSGSKTPLAGRIPSAITRGLTTNSSLPHPWHRGAGQLFPHDSPAILAPEFLHGTTRNPGHSQGNIIMDHRASPRAYRVNSPTPRTAPFEGFIGRCVEESSDRTGYVVH